MKNKKSNNVTIWIICGVILVVLVAIIIVLIVNGSNGKLPVPENNEEIIEKPVVKYTEQDLIDAYGVSIKDAEAIALEAFHSDNYECETVITEKGTYLVTVKDTIDNSKYVFDVDPQTKTAFLKEK